MFEHVSVQRSPLLRAIFSFVHRLASVSLGVLALAMAAYIVIAPRCPSIEPEFAVTPSDVHGKLEYCVAEVKYAGRSLNPRLVVTEQSECGADKALLTARARTLTQEAADAIAQCNLAMLKEPHLVVWRRIQGWLASVTG